MCHRDFNNPKGNEIAVFKNRIEIYNPGRFPDDHSPEEFIKGKERSILRNPLIANAFYLTSDIERWGSGLKRIHDDCRGVGVKVEFENLKTGFLVTFYRQEQKLDGVKGSGKVVGKGGQIGGRIGGQKRWSELTEKQKNILKLIGKNPIISRKALSDKLNINPSAVQKHLQKLKTQDFLRRIGPDRGGYWKIVDKK